MSSSAAAFLFFALIIPCSLAELGPGLPQLWQHAIEKRGSFDSLGSLFTERDECGTQYGATYVDCGSRGCYQPSLGQICCASTGLYCDAGQFCTGNYCCPDGLTAGCCDTGNGCPANVSSYYLTSTSAPAPVGSTSLPVSVSTTAALSTTSPEGSTSAVVVMTTPLTTSPAVVVMTTPSSTTPAPVHSTTSALAGIGTTSSAGVVTSSTLGGTTSTPTSPGTSSSVAKSGAQGVRMQMGIEGIAVGVLGIAAFVAALI